MRIEFSEIAWDEYLEWERENKKHFKKIQRFIKEVQRDPVGKGTGKAEILKGGKGRSKRIDDYHRFAYDVQDDVLKILSLKGHYD